MKFLANVESDRANPNSINLRVTNTSKGVGGADNEAHRSQRAHERCGWMHHY